MLGVFHAGPSLFRAGWLVESLATQTLIIFAIRTRRPLTSSRPSNILIVRNGRRLQAKLADFGLAKNFELAGLSQLTADNELRGTPAFMPWEQLRDSRYSKPTVDIYSAAATLVYYLTGQSPGHSTSGSSPLDNLGHLPTGLRDVLDKALAAQPKHRYATAAELRHALLPFANATRKT